MRRFTSDEGTDQVLDCFFNELQKVHMEYRRADEIKISIAGMCAILHNIRPGLRLEFCREVVEFLKHSEDDFNMTEPQRIVECRDKLGVIVKDMVEKIGEDASSEDIEKEIVKRVKESGLPFDVKVMSLDRKVIIPDGNPDGLNTLDIHGLRKMLAEADEHDGDSKKDDETLKKCKKGD